MAKEVDNKEVEQEPIIPPVDENGHMQGELGENVSPLSRMITDVYLRLHYIEDYEREDFVKSLEQPSKNKLVQKFNDLLDGITSSKIGSLLSLLIMKLFMRWLTRLDYETDEDKLRHDAKMALTKELYNDIAPGVADE